MSTETILVLLFVVMLLYALARLFVGPLHTVLGAALYFCLGIALLYLGNWVGGFFGASIAYNPYNALVAGFLNLPGVVLLFAIRYWLRI